MFSWYKPRSTFTAVGLEGIWRTNVHHRLSRMTLINIPSMAALRTTELIKVFVWDSLSVLARICFTWSSFRNPFSLSLPTNDMGFWSWVLISCLFFCTLRRRLRCSSPGPLGKNDKFSGGTWSTYPFVFYLGSGSLEMEEIVKVLYVRYLQNHMLKVLNPSWNKVTETSCIAGTQYLVNP